MWGIFFPKFIQLGTPSIRTCTYSFDQTLAPDAIGTLWYLISAGTNGSHTLWFQ